ncbi:hypothetical protein Taro_044842 [Colocasia esculenta]|uniref:CCHC-type domain-containing protein n=1 Tax=Colocasia esculenta TaxID=4460 RepID=A0A843WZ24_COLES|nr:hypothetical protein [Colocasia esculenta]
MQFHKAHSIAAAIGCVAFPRRAPHPWRCGSSPASRCPHAEFAMECLRLSSPFLPSSSPRPASARALCPCRRRALSISPCDSQAHSIAAAIGCVAFPRRAAHPWRCGSSPASRCPHAESAMECLRLSSPFLPSSSPRPASARALCPCRRRALSISPVSCSSGIPGGEEDDAERRRSREGNLLRLLQISATVTVVSASLPQPHAQAKVSERKRSRKKADAVLSPEELKTWSRALPVVSDRIPYTEVLKLKEEGKLKHIIKLPGASLRQRPEVVLVVLEDSRVLRAALPTIERDEKFWEAWDGKQMGAVCINAYTPPIKKPEMPSPYLAFLARITMLFSRLRKTKPQSKRVREIEKARKELAARRKAELARVREEREMMEKALRAHKKMDERRKSLEERKIKFEQSLVRARKDYEYMGLVWANMARDRNIATVFALGFFPLFYYFVVYGYRKQQKDFEDRRKIEKAEAEERRKMRELERELAGLEAAEDEGEDEANQQNPYLKMAAKFMQSGARVRLAHGKRLPQYMERGIDVKFSDVAGLGKIRLELEEIVKFFTLGEMYRRRGVKIPGKGVSSQQTKFSPPSGCCFRCLEKGHRASACRNAVKCFRCKGVGHRSLACRSEALQCLEACLPDQGIAPPEPVGVGEKGLQRVVEVPWSPFVKKDWARLGACGVTEVRGAGPDKYSEGWLVKFWWIRQLHDGSFLVEFPHKAWKDYCVSVGTFRRKSLTIIWRQWSVECAAELVPAGKLLWCRLLGGILLCGPPGVGKTLLAKAVAGEAGVNFFSISASQFVEIYVGVGASRVRALYQEAKENAPSVVFIDELDAVGRERGLIKGSGGQERGILLCGPPGVGKTLLAKAVAGEAGVNFFSISASQFVEIYVGVGASRVRALYQEAKENAPSVVFIDELDAVGRERGLIKGSGGQERDATLNQLLVCLDGFEGRGNVITIAATNRPDILDPALVRPGRFDRKIYIPKPGLIGRKEILEVHARKKPMASDVDYVAVASMTEGMVGAELANIVEVAAIYMIRDGRTEVWTSESVSSLPERPPERCNQPSSEGNSCTTKAGRRTSDPDLQGPGKEARKSGARPEKSRRVDSFMSHINTQATETYASTLQATEEIEAPAVGFAKPADNKGSTSGTTILIKQNNTQIELLVRLTEEVKALREEFAQFRKEKGQVSTIPDDLISGLKNLKLSDHQKPKEAAGKLRAMEKAADNYYRILGEMAQLPKPATMLHDMSKEALKERKKVQGQLALALRDMEKCLTAQYSYFAQHATRDNYWGDHLQDLQERMEAFHKLAINVMEYTMHTTHP